MIKEGDVIRWKTVNSFAQGKVVLSNEGKYIVRMDNGHSFHLRDIRYAKSAVLIVR